MKETLATLKGWLVGIGICVFLAAVVFPNINPYYQTIFMLSAINIALATSLTLINGFTGQFSLGHAGFMAVGGYTSAAITFYFTDRFINAGVPEGVVFGGSLVAGGAMAAASGWLVGRPSLRLKGDYLAVVTLGFGEIIRVVFLNVEALGGARGLTGLRALTDQWWALGLAFLATFIAGRLLGTPQGRAMLSVREDEVAAEAMGVDTTGVKVGAFVLGSLLAGVTGGMYAHYYGNLNPGMFSFMKGFEVVVIVVLGGLGSVSGAVVGAIALSILPEALRPLQRLIGVDLRMIIYSLLLILFMLARPEGLFGRHEFTHFLRRRRKQ